MSRLSAAVVLSLLAGWVQAAPQVQVVGLFPGAAVLNVDGVRKLVKAGQTGPGGVQVISVDRTGAVLRVEGAERRYEMSRDVSQGGAAAAKPRYSVARSNDGHYWTPGTVKGQTVQFLVDTGATSIAMNEAHARRLGIDYRVDGRPMVVNTASGVARAWQVTLPTVKVGGIEVVGVEAAVLQGDAPTEPLLGMSFLNRVRWREDQGMLLIEPKY